MEEAIALLLAEQSICKHIQKLLPISSSHLFQYFYFHFVNLLQSSPLPTSLWDAKLFGKNYFHHCTFFEKFCFELYLFQFLFKMNQQLVHELVQQIPKNQQSSLLLTTLKQEMKFLSKVKKNVCAMYTLDWKEMIILLQHPIATTSIPLEYFQCWIYLEKHILCLQLCLTKIENNWQWYQEMRNRVQLFHNGNQSYLLLYPHVQLTKHAFTFHQLLVQQFITNISQQSIVNLFLKKQPKKKHAMFPTNHSRSDHHHISNQSNTLLQVFLFSHLCKKNQLIS